MLRRILTSLALAATGVVLVATPAAADGAGPSDYRSRITSIEPPTDFIDARIIGGDSFLELSVDEGHEVIVFGYQGEPYLRFREDGVVERNRRSPATYINDDRRGEVTPPADADADAEPDWVEVADGGTYAWHDHRMHVMPGFNTARFDETATLPWLDQVELLADGEPVVIDGTITREEAPTPIPWLVLALVAAGLLAWRAPPVVAIGSVAATALLATWTGYAEYATSPADSGANPLLWLLPVAAVVLAGGALALRARAAISMVLGLGAVALLSSSGLLRFNVLVKPVLPSDLPDWLDRASVALALGVSVGAAYALLVRSIPAASGSGTAPAPQPR